MELLKCLCKWNISFLLNISSLKSIGVGNGYLDTVRLVKRNNKTHFELTTDGAPLGERSSHSPNTANLNFLSTYPVETVCPFFAARGYSIG